MFNVNVYVEVCRDDVELPEYAHKNDSGMDVRSAGDVTIEPGQTVIIPTGLKVAIPLGYEIQVRPRSGVSYKTPLRIANAPGTIDCAYKDEIGIIVTNTSQLNAYNEIFTLESKHNKQGTYQIKKGDRIAQLVLQTVPQISWVKVTSVAEVGSNRNGGFGSTGIK